MVYCVVCGTSNEDEARFCINCGAELVIPEDIITEPSLKQEETAKEEVPEVEVKVPKKRGRKGKAEEVQKPDEDVLGEEEAIIATEEIVAEEEAVKKEEASIESVKPEPEALEWKAPQPAAGYIAPAMPREHVHAEEAYHPAQTQYIPNPYVGRMNEDNHTVTVNNPPVETGRNKPMSTGAYFWLIVLYTIPGIGLLMSIILSFAPSNLNLKRFSRAALIFRIVCIITSLILVLVLVIVLQNLKWDWFYEFQEFVRYNNLSPHVTVWIG